MPVRRKDREALDSLAETCLMIRARFVSRAITSIYEDELRPIGLKGSQLSLLASIALAGAISRVELGRMMHLDASTLTRNLRVMETNGWVETVAAGDGRGRPIRVTKKGDTLLLAAMPAWKRSQRKAVDLLGNDGRTALLRLAGVLAS